MEECLSEDLLINELHSKERGARVELLGVQLDEMWSFVGNKSNKKWIWLALNPANRQIIAFHMGDRSAESAQELWLQIPAIFHQMTGFFSDYWKAYQAVFDPDTHFPVGKSSGLTSYIERFNNTLRQRCSRLVRKALTSPKMNKIILVQSNILSVNTIKLKQT